MLYGAVLRSPLAHARIGSIDLTEARKARGVKVIVTGKDFPFLFGGMLRDQPFLAIDRVRHVANRWPRGRHHGSGSPGAAGKIKVQYEELPAVFDPREGLAEGAPIITKSSGNTLWEALTKNIPRNECLHDPHFFLGGYPGGLRPIGPDF